MFQDEPISLICMETSDSWTLHCQKIFRDHVNNHSLPLCCVVSMNLTSFPYRAPSHFNWQPSETHTRWIPPTASQKERESKHPTRLIAWLLTVSNTFNSLFKVLFTFPSWYLCSIDLLDIFSFGSSLAPVKTALPSSPTLRKPFVRGGLQAKDRAITCRCITFQWTKTCATLWTNFHTLHLTTQKHCDYKFELFPVHSQLLRKSLLVSFPPLSYMLKSRGLPCLAWLVRYKIVWIYLD